MLYVGESIFKVLVLHSKEMLIGIFKSELDLCREINAEDII